MKITRKMQKNIQWISILLLLGTVGYTMMNFDVNNYLGYFSSDALFPTIIGFIIVYFLWKFSKNELSKFPIEIIENKHKPKPSHNKTFVSNKRRISLLSVISSILAVPFVLMVLIFTYTALGNPEHITIIYFDKFSEFWIEIIVFTISGGIVILGTIFNIRTLMTSKKQLE